jgi:hypothetical protein
MGAAEMTEMTEMTTASEIGRRLLGEIQRAARMKEVFGLTFVLIPGESRINEEGKREWRIAQKQINLAMSKLALALQEIAADGFQAGEETITATLDLLIDLLHLMPDDERKDWQRLIAAVVPQPWPWQYVEQGAGEGDVA